MTNNRDDTSWALKPCVWKNLRRIIYLSFPIPWPNASLHTSRRPRSRPQTSMEHKKRPFEAVRQNARPTIDNDCLAICHTSSIGHVTIKEKHKGKYTRVLHLQYLSKSIYHLEVSFSLFI